MMLFWVVPVVAIVSVDENISMVLKEVDGKI